MSVLERRLALVPRFLSSHPHIVFLICLGFYLIVLPLFGFKVSTSAELIGGNYTNVTSDIGACVAAGMAVRISRQHHVLHAKIDALQQDGEPGNPGPPGTHALGRRADDHRTGLHAELSPVPPARQVQVGLPVSQVRTRLVQADPVVDLPR